MAICVYYVHESELTTCTLAHLLHGHSAAVPSMAHLAGLGRCDAQSARPREMNTHR